MRRCALVSLPTGRTGLSVTARRVSPGASWAAVLEASIMAPGVLPGAALGGWPRGTRI